MWVFRVRGKDFIVSLPRDEKFERGEHARLLKGSDCALFFDFYYDFYGFLPSFQGIFPYMSFFSRTAQERLDESY